MKLNSENKGSREGVDCTIHKGLESKRVIIENLANCFSWRIRESDQAIVVSIRWSNGIHIAIDVELSTFWVWSLTYNILGEEEQHQKQQEHHN